MIIQILLIIFVGILIIAWFIISIIQKKYLLTVAIGLLLFGVFAIQSVSIFESFQLTLRISDEPTNYFYFLRQIEHILISLITAWLVLFIPLDKIKKNAVKIFILVFLVQLLIFTPLGQVFHGARWWIYLPGLGSVQPSEFFKLWFIIFLSAWLIRKKKELNSLELFFAIILISWLSFFVFLLIPDLGTLLVVWPVVLILYWYVWGRLIYIIFSIILWLTLWLTIGMQFDYIRKRVEFFVNPDIDQSHQWIWWQTKQWLIAIWSWWPLWKWYGKWLQKFGFIPEAQSDFIFAAFSEEIGFLGNTILLLLYFLLIYIALTRLKWVKDEYLRNLVVWIVSLIWMQVFINIWVNIKLIPLTGLTLPFVSYWGTALMVNVWEVVLLYKILYNNYIPQKKKSRSFVYTSIRSELP